MIDHVAPASKSTIHRINQGFTSHWTTITPQRIILRLILPALSPIDPRAYLSSDYATGDP